MNKLVVIEGPDGSGKSTLARLLRDALEERGIAASLLREPGGTPLGESIREILRDPSRTIDPRAETLLFCAARAALADRIREMLQTGWVVLDRYEGSTAVYQGIVRGLDPERVMEISRWSSDNLVPDHTLVLMLGPEESLHRRRGRGAEDRMETTTDPGRVIEGYRWLSEQPLHTPISAEGTPEEALGESLRALGI